ncbi:MAG: hypothetical protein U0231_00650 [Nitrospiraceae bacterium]
MPDWLDLALTVFWMVGIVVLQPARHHGRLSAGVGLISAAFLCVVAMLVAAT